MTDESRIYTIGVIPYSPLIGACALNLTSWTPPYPPECRQPGMLVEVFDLLARHASINYSILEIVPIDDETQNAFGDEVAKHMYYKYFIHIKSRLSLCNEVTLIWLSLYHLSRISWTKKANP